MSILFAGTPENAALSLRLLVESGVSISLVITRPDAPVGRKSVLTASPVALVALELGLPLIKTNIVDDDVIQQIQLHGIEFALVIAFGVILREPALSALDKGWYNVHYSLLPRWRGASPVQRAIISGDSETGVTVFKIDTGLDTGPVLGSVRTKIEPTETFGNLLHRLSLLGVSLLSELLPKISSGILRLDPQAALGASVAPKVTRREVRLNFSRTATELSNLVRGANPEPGAWVKTSLNVELKVHEARSVDYFNLGQGACELIDGRLLVGCQNGALELLEVQPAGKKSMKASDWFRGTTQVVTLESYE